MKRPAFPAPAATRARVTRWICLACIGLLACAADEQSAPPPRQELQLIAGNIGGRGVIDGAGAADGVGPAAQFQDPRSLTIDGAGNLYVADGANATIRKITPAGVVTTIAGTAAPRLPKGLPPVSRAAGPRGIAAANDGMGPAAQFNSPWGIAADAEGTLYVADTGSNTIRRIAQDGVVTTVAGKAGGIGSNDGIGADARFSSPAGLAADAAGNLYVVDQGNGIIRRITPAGVVSTLAGTAGLYGYADGVGPAARFLAPWNIAADSSGNLYVTEGNQTIRKITPVGVVTTLAGTAGVAGNADGIGAAARFNWPGGIAADAAGNLYVADGFNYTLRKVTPAGVVTTVAGVPGQQGIRLGPLPASLDVPQGVTVIDSDTLAVTSGASVLRVILR